MIIFRTFATYPADRKHCKRNQNRCRTYLVSVRNHEPWVSGNNGVILDQHLFLLLGCWVSLRPAGVKQPPRERLYLVLLGCDWWKLVRLTDRVPRMIRTDR